MPCYVTAGVPQLTAAGSRRTPGDSEVSLRVLLITAAARGHYDLTLFHHTAACLPSCLLVFFPFLPREITPLSFHHFAITGVDAENCLCCQRQQHLLSNTEDARQCVVHRGRRFIPYASVFNTEQWRFTFFKCNHPSGLQFEKQVGK